jgi:hypothetical protein
MSQIAISYPTRQPRHEPSLEEYNYYDHEIVIQPDGRMAKFSFQSKQRDLGWQFDYYEDVDGFRIWTEKDDPELLISAEVPIVQVVDHHTKMPTLVDGEVLKAYLFGGAMSQRAGLFTIMVDRPSKIVRSKRLWMS